MKKKWIPVVVFAVILFVCMAAYTISGSRSNVTNTLDSVNERLQPTSISDLYYDVDTKIVYIIFKEGFYQSYSYMSAYYAPNGLPYLYDPETNTLQEIISEQ